jgi:hypothetical protein
MKMTFKCHARKTSKISNLRPAEVTITVENPTFEQVSTYNKTVSPTINWVAGSSTDDSVDVVIDLPGSYFGTLLKFTIAVVNNDLLICGYDPGGFQIVSNPLWDGERGPYDITGHTGGGGLMGNGSLAILDGQTVTFDADLSSSPFDPTSA